MSVSTTAESNKARVLLSKETSYAEVPATPTMQEMRVTGETLAIDKKTVVSSTIRSDRQREFLASVAESIKGNLDFELTFAGLESIFEGALSYTSTLLSLTGLTLTVAAGPPVTVTRSAGSFVTDGVQAGQYVRFGGFTNAGNNGVFKVASVTATELTLDTSATGLTAETGTAAGQTLKGRMIRNGVTPLSYLVEKQFTDIGKYISIRGCRVNTLQVDVTAGAIVKCVAGLLGQQAEVASATVAGTVTPATTTDFLTASGNVGTITENGTAMTAYIKSLKLDTNNNLREKDQIGSLYPFDLGYGFFDVKGTLDAYFEDETLLNQFLNHDAVSISFQVTDATGNVIVFTLPRIYFETGSPNITAGNADVMISLNFQAVRDPTAQYTMQVDLIAA